MPTGVHVNNKQDAAIQDKAKGFVYGTYPGSPQLIIAAVTLAPTAQRGSITVAGANYNVTLPPASNCKGRGMYTVNRPIAAGGGFSATMVDPDGIMAAAALTNANGHWAGFSDGQRWYTVSHTA